MENMHQLRVYGTQYSKFYKFGNKIRWNDGVNQAPRKENIQKFTSNQDKKRKWIYSSLKCFPVVKTESKEKKWDCEPPHLGNKKGYYIYIQDLPVREFAGLKGE
jgi:hypothetical protein